ncbi:MAG TPA: phosphatase PAP2 family protein [Muribaculaceae bacterium]|jgi:undecaprenyl-diphosphatase|nr:phosphatase PAP2 family protein [Muribaculaceae bacterium]
MIETLQQIDTQIFLLFNGLHLDLLDQFMYTFSGRWVWIPLYAATLAVLIHRYGWQKGLLMLVATVAAVTIADQVCATHIRPAVERLRPANMENPISALVHTVNGYRGGRYGFPSCHAANTFAFATIISLALPMRRLTIILFLWAIGNCYSRIYLGVHYPGDLLAGAVIGTLAGLLCYMAWKWACRHSVRLSSTPTRKTISIRTHKFADTDIIAATFILTVISIAVKCALAQ